MKTLNPFDINCSYKTLHSSFPTYKKTPIIGITANFQGDQLTLTEGYYTSVIAAGGTPVLFPPFNPENPEQTDAMINFLEHIDGLILTGGADVNPLYMNEDPIRQLGTINARRDAQEWLLCRLAANRQIPILGICRGMQILNVALGGTLYQDIYTQAEGELLKHSQDLDKGVSSHRISFAEDSLLHSIFGTDTCCVNSFHHQAVKEAAPSLKVTARASDNIIEAIESKEHKAIIGVQWHPECYLPAQDWSMMPLFEWLTTEARLFAEAKQIHRNNLILDTHCDTPMFFHQHIDFGSRDSRIRVDLHKMHEGRQDATIMVAYLPQLGRTPAELVAATVRAHQTLDEIEKMVAGLSSQVGIAYTPDDLYRLKAEGKKAVMLGIENGYAIGTDIHEVARFRKRGVVYMTLCHNGNNDICGSCRHNEEDLGLTNFGREVIAEMNRSGMIIDLSHAGDRTIAEAIEQSRNPVVCSHSSARALCNHPRNVTDEQLKAIAQKGGVVQVCIYDDFLRSDRNAHIGDVIDHINHMVKVAGIDHVGIGTDFDGDGGVTGCYDSSELIQVTRHLLAARYNDDDLRKIWGENFLRVMRQVQTNTKF